MRKFVIKRVINEHPIEISKLKLKGHIDMILFAEIDSIPVCLIIDIKSIASYPYKKKFGRSYNREQDPSIHQELQLATYALAVEKDFGVSDSQMFLVYYNKDNSKFKVLPVKRNFMNQAMEYWMTLNSYISKDLPKIDNINSPIKGWECNYCQYKDKCTEDHKQGV